MTFQTLNLVIRLVFFFWGFSQLFWCFSSSSASDTGSSFQTWPSGYKGGDYKGGQRNKTMLVMLVLPHVHAGWRWFARQTDHTAILAI